MLEECVKDKEVTSLYKQLVQVLCDGEESDKAVTNGDCCEPVEKEDLGIMPSYLSFIEHLVSAQHFALLNIRLWPVYFGFRYKRFFRKKRSGWRQWQSQNRHPRTCFPSAP